jgi:hypothetical protein
MIIQGSNSPITIAFDSDVSNVIEWSVALFGEDRRGMPSILLKHWGTGDLLVNGSVVCAPLTESETMDFMPCVATLEVKWLDGEDNIFHSDTARIRVSGRKDKTVLIQNGDLTEEPAVIPE